MNDVGIKISAQDATGNAFNSVQGKLAGLKNEAGGIGASVGDLVGKFNALGIAITAATTVGAFKTAVDTADAFNKMAQKTGIAVEKLRELNYAAGLSDVSTEALGTSLRKLSINMASAEGGSKAQAEVFKALGLSVKDASGQLKGADVLLTEVAAKFATFKDGPEKAALAVQLFGKSGAELIPLLNAGATGLGDMAKEARDLGDVFSGDMAKQAEDFNDNLTRIGIGAKSASYSLAAELLPTINAVAEEFLIAQKNSSGFGSFIGGALKTTLQTAVLLFSDFAFVIKGIAREIGGIVAQFSALGEGGGIFSAKGRAAWNAVGDAMKEDAAKARADLDRFQQNLMNPADKSVGAAYNARQGFGETYQTRAPVVSDGTAKTISEAAKGLELYNSLMAQAAGFEKSWADDANKLRAALDGKKISQDQFNESVNALLQKQPLMVAAAKLEAEWQKELIKSNEDVSKARDDSLKSIQAELDKQLEQNAAIGLTVVQLAELEAAKLTNLAIDKDRLAVEADLIDWSGQLGQKYREEAAALRDLASAKVSGASKKVAFDAAQDVQKEFKKAAEDIEKSMTDALMRAFESGKGFFQSLWDTIKNMMKTQVLKVFVQPIAGGLATAFAGNAAAGTSSGGNLIGTAGTLKSMYDTLSGGFTQIGSTVSAGFNTLATSSIGQSLGMSSAATIGNNASAYVAPQMTSGSLAASSAIGTVAGYAAGAAAGLAIGNAISGEFGSSNTTTAGTIIGSIVGGPIGGAIGGAIGGLVNRAFGMGNTEVVSQGTRGTFAAGGSFSGQNYANYRKEGGWFRSDDNWSETSPIDQRTVQSWETAFKGVKLSMTGMANSLGLATTEITKYTKYIDIAAGTTAEQITALFTKMADDMASAVAPSIAMFAKTGETASTTLTRLSQSITTANAWLAMLRNRLFDISLAGADAASKLADAFGGLDNLAASSKAYYETFYTEAEKTSIAADNLAKAMALIGVALPDTKAAFRDIVTSLDLTTDSGRNAYAVMLALAPEYAAMADAADKAAQATAKSLLAAFTGNDQIVPALQASALAISDVATGAGSMTTALSYINKVMGDASSGVITLGGNVVTLGTGLTNSQVSAGLLNDQIVAIKNSADAAKINFAALGTALANVDTATFVSTVALVFENLAARIKSVISSISAERVAVREAALSIINPTAMSKAEIQRGIEDINTSLPSNAAAVAANTTLATADATLANIKTLSVNAANATSKMATDLAYYQGKVGDLYALTVGQDFTVRSTVSDGPNNAYAYQASTNRFDPYAWNSFGTDGINATDYQRFLDTQSQRDSLKAILNQANPTMAADEAAIASASKALASANTTLTAATDAQVAAQIAAKKAALDYAAALQIFTIDAGKSVAKLTNLREQTVKYYEAQKALADLMMTSAAGLRKTIADYQYSTLTPEQQLASLQGQFSTAYSMALASQGDGATLAGYGDKVNALLGPLITKLQEVGTTGLIGTYLAQAESVAALIDKMVPVNYQQDSLDMLGSIDATLAALDTATRSAEQVIADAVTAGADRTATGLKLIGEAISGQTIPAFATGGSYSGGMALVGEDGPEVINFNRPGQVYNAQQTQGMFGNNEAVITELRALRAEVGNLRAEARSTAVSSNKTAKILERVTPDGVSLQTVAA